MSNVLAIVGRPNVGKSTLIEALQKGRCETEKDSTHGIIIQEWPYEEGCLSIPGVREDVFRAEELKLKWFDENWVAHEEIFDDMNARVIQHEYDHVDGVLFTDHLSGLKKRLLKKRLVNISKGKVDADYRMRFPSK